MTFCDHVAVRRLLDDAVKERQLLDHPFYRAWSAGTLTRDDLRFYSTQYWRQVERFPGYLRDLLDRVSHERVRATLQENLRDEIEGDHPALWLTFADSVGSSPERTRASAPAPETTRCVERFSSAARSESVPFALGMLYGYESQTPEVARVKVDGLKSNYGMQDGFGYFEVHAEMDIEHSAELAGAIADLVEDADSLTEAEAGSRAGAEAIWGLLDGVARLRAVA